jgi:uncharacterized cupin superfamily protein
LVAVAIGVLCWQFLLSANMMSDIQTSPLGTISSSNCTYASLLDAEVRLEEPRVKSSWFGKSVVMASFTVGTWGAAYFVFTAALSVLYAPIPAASRLPGGFISDLRPTIGNGPTMGSRLREEVRLARHGHGSTLQAAGGGSAGAGLINEGQISEERKKTLGIERWSTWGCGVSEFPWTYGDREAFYIIKGVVTITPNGGQPMTFGAGDFGIAPAGMSCTWKVTQDLEKYYRFG